MTKVIRAKQIQLWLINIELTKLMSCNLLLLVLIKIVIADKKEILIFWWVSGTFRLVIHRFAPGMNWKKKWVFERYKTKENVQIFLLVWPLFWWLFGQFSVVELEVLRRFHLIFSDSLIFPPHFWPFSKNRDILITVNEPP